MANKIKSVRYSDSFDCQVNNELINFIAGLTDNELTSPNMKLKFMKYLENKYDFIYTHTVLKNEVDQVFSEYFKCIEDKIIHHIVVSDDTTPKAYKFAMEHLTYNGRLGDTNYFQFTDLGHTRLMFFMPVVKWIAQHEILGCGGCQWCEPKFIPKVTI